LRAIGRALSRYHADLAEAFGIGPTYDVRRCVASASLATAAAARLVLRDPGLTDRRRQALGTALGRALGEAVTLAQQAGPVRSAPCHGDLHLAHIVLRHPAVVVGRPVDRVVDSLCLLDSSLAATQPNDPAFATQTPWYDLACLGRALDYFASEECYQVVGDRVGLPWGEACRADLDLALGATTAWSGDEVRLLRRLKDLTQQWLRSVRRELLSGYIGHAGTRHPSDLAPVLRLGRLLHELEYEYEHDRQGYRTLVLRHVLAEAGHPGRTRSW